MKNASTRGSESVDSSKIVARTVIRKFVSTTQAAELLGYSKRSGSINRLIEEGLIEAEHGPGHGLLVYLDSLESYRQHHLKTGGRRRGRPRAKPDTTVKRVTG